MAEEMDRIEGVFPYVYDRFTVFFYGDRVFIGGKDYPIGQCCVDVMNVGDAVLDEIDRRVKAFVPPPPATCSQKKQTAPPLSHRRNSTLSGI